MTLCHCSALCQFTALCHCSALCPCISLRNCLHFVLALHCATVLHCTVPLLCTASLYGTVPLLCTVSRHDTVPLCALCSALHCDPTLCSRDFWNSCLRQLNEHLVSLFYFILLELKSWKMLTSTILIHAFFVTSWRRVLTSMCQLVALLQT